MAIKNKLPEHLLRSLQNHLEPVGFRQETVLPSFDNYRPPTRSFLWRSAYAVVLLCAIKVDDRQDLIASKDEASLWMDTLLAKMELSGRFLDGYLILAFEEKPVSDSLRESIRLIEEDTSVCRKHVLWPKDGSWEGRLMRLTVLSLPAPQEPAEPIEIPVLPEELSRYWSDFQKSGNKVAAAGTLLAEID